MQNFAQTWSLLSAGKKTVILGATLLAFVAVLVLSRGVGARNMSLLFGGLDGPAAAEVLTSLDQQGVVYEVRGSAVYVPSAERDALRLALSGQGIPAAGGQGYELLDNLSGFATTSQMFDAAYWRAKEGELARTIVANPRYRSARVHISAASNQPFQRDAMPTAAVNIGTASGTIGAGQVRALQYLVASAVQGLDPSDVAIIDQNGGLVSGSDDPSLQPGGEDRAEILRARAERVLAARVGPGNAVVEITLETINEAETISERIVDPESRVAISTDVQESAGKSEDSRGSAVTVASNVPDGDAAGEGGNAANESSETRSLTNYEVSETQRNLVRSPGSVKRLTVAVLVNDVVTVDASGAQTSTPRTPEELADLQELVSAAVGFDENRGDQMTLRAMSFEPRPELGTEVTEDGAGGVPLDMMQLIQIGVLAGVALILGLFVVRPILSGSGSVTALPAPDGELDTGFGTDDGPQIMSGFPDMMSIDGPDMGGMGMGDMGSLDGLGGDAGGGDDPVGKLRQMIADRETETLEILENWMEEPNAQEEMQS